MKPLNRSQQQVYDRVFEELMLRETYYRTLHGKKWRDAIKKIARKTARLESPDVSTVTQLDDSPPCGCGC